MGFFNELLLLFDFTFVFGFACLFSVILMGVFVYLLMSFIMISEGHVAVLLKKGQFDRLLHPGWHFYNPLTYGLAKKKWTRSEEKSYNGIQSIVTKTYQVSILSTAEQVYDMPEFSALSEDLYQIIVNPILKFKIMDARAVMFNVEDFYAALETLTETQLRSKISAIKAEDIFSVGSKEQIENHIKQQLSGCEDRWGFNIITFDIQSFQHSKGIKDATELSLQRKRENDTKIMMSKGERERQLLETSIQVEVQQKQLENKMEINRRKAENERRIAQENADNEMEIQRKKAENESEINKIRFTREIDRVQQFISGIEGMEINQYLELLKIQKLTEVLSNPANSFTLPLPPIISSSILPHEELPFGNSQSSYYQTFRNRNTNQEKVLPL